AHLRVPLRERPRLRGHAEDVGRPGHGVRDLRRPRAARLPPHRGALQGLGLLQHGLRHREAQARERRVGEVGRRQERREAGGQEDGLLDLVELLLLLFVGRQAGVHPQQERL
ncbi:MAG: Putative regulatory protein, FmdB, partial [uncultured Solirubrobacteraceae bacterium]